MKTDAPDFRRIARKSLERAKAELATNDPHRARYAALELRDAMESLTYDRAMAFKDDIPPDEYRTWQPRKLMAVLLEIDPSIGMTSTLRFGLQEEYGKRAPREKMKTIGTDFVLGMDALKAHYDAIGSFLHMPSLEQIQSGRIPDPVKLRGRCETVASVVESVLTSRVWNGSFGRVSMLGQCMNENCGKPVRRRMPHGKDPVDAECIECKAQYTLTKEDDGQVLWMPKKEDAPCSTQGCSEKMSLWLHQIKPGTRWQCRGCGVHNVIELMVMKNGD
jgi:hypothetical protein